MRIRVIMSLLGRKQQISMQNHDPEVVDRWAMAFGWSGALKGNLLISGQKRHNYTNSHLLKTF